MTISPWRAEKNRRALARLRRALPETFPAPVLTHALSRPFTPPTPRIAIDGYWRAHRYGPIGLRVRWRPRAARRPAGPGG